MLANNLIRLIVSVAILAAVYLFVIRPILDTTNNAFNSFNNTMDSAFSDFGVDGVNVSEIKKGNFGDIQKQLQQSNLSTKDQRRAEKLLHCVQRVQPDTTKMQACAEKYRP